MSNNYNGWIVLDKPEGLSSHQALSRVKKLLKTNKIGHAGTLDPFATGMLLVTVGEATKLQDYAMNSSKEYIFSINFGTSTDTCDNTGVVIDSSDKIPLESDLRSVLEDFGTGYDQVPPQYSAININGQRAYKMARAGKQFEINARSVQILDSKLISFIDNVAIIKCKVGKGFYIRSYATDICQKLGVSGHVSSLRRTMIGNATENRMITADQLETGDLNTLLLPVEYVLEDSLIYNCNESQAKNLRDGKVINNFTGQTGIVFISHNSKLIAICEADEVNIKSKRGMAY